MGCGPFVSWSMQHYYWHICGAIYYGSNQIEIIFLAILTWFTKYLVNKKGFTKINLSKWKRIIITRSISIVPCVVITLLAIDSIHHLNFWCNIVKAIQLPFALLPILHFTSCKRIMGSFRTNILLRLVCYFITMCILSINVYFVVIIIVSVKT